MISIEAFRCTVGLFAAKLPNLFRKKMKKMTRKKRGDDVAVGDVHSGQNIAIFFAAVLLSTVVLYSLPFCVFAIVCVDGSETVTRQGDFFLNIVRDYRAAVRDMVQDMKDAPRKSAFYLTLLGSGIVLAKTSPSQVSFQEQLWHSQHELLLLGDRIRNRLSDTHVQFLLEQDREGTLRYTNCGLFSLMWVADYDASVDKFEARCGLIKPRWVDFHKQVVDVGVLGRWRWLTQAMVEYDVNVDEWDDQGHKRKTQQQS